MKNLNNAFDSNPRPTNLFLSSIVIADSNFHDVAVTMKMLKAIPLYNPIVHLVDGEEVLDYLCCTGKFEGHTLPDPSLIILDTNLHKLNGIEVLRYIKGNPSKQHIPVVMLTNSMEIRDAVESCGLGANSYLSKPIDVRQFSDAISTLGMYWGLINSKCKKAASSHVTRKRLKIVV